MEARRLLPLLTLFFLAGLTSAHTPSSPPGDNSINNNNYHDVVPYKGVEYYFPQRTFEYANNNFDLEVHCRPIGTAGIDCGLDSNMPDHYGRTDPGDGDVYIEICNTKIQKKTEYKASGYSNPYARYSLPFGLFSIPGKAPCSLGSHPIKITWYPNDSAMVQGGYIDVQAKNMADPNKGYYIYLEMKYDGDDNHLDHISGFHLSNEPWYDDDQESAVAPGAFNELPDRDAGRPVPKGTYFLVADKDRGEEQGIVTAGNKDDDAVLEPNYGAQFQAPKDLNFPDIYLSNWTGSDHNWPNIFKTEPDQIVNDIMEYGMGDTPEKYDNTCGVAHNDGSSPYSCSPIHKNGDFETDGEVIVATELSKSSFYSASNQDKIKNENTHFYICRGSYKGSDIQSSQKVKVQYNSASCPPGSVCAIDPAWKYYRCTQNKNWKEFTCPPGKIFDNRPALRGWDCYVVEDTYINATLFNIQNIPDDTLKNGFIGGLKIPAADMNQFEKIMNRDAEHVNAECWMGDDDQRTNGPRVKLEYDYDGTGAAWVLGEIPYRSGVNNKTYSCVWGLSSYESGKTNIWESTQHSPLLGLDERRVDKNYGALESRYYDLSYLYSIHYVSNPWSGYWGTQRDSYTDTWDEQMFRKDAGATIFTDYVEYPYCPGNEGSSMNTFSFNEIICD
ncbi:MAG: hypothetical protein ABEJ36_03600 [Candidatus Nanosalina sp.]